jgi:hypothetical protein
MKQLFPLLVDIFLLIKAIRFPYKKFTNDVLLPLQHKRTNEAFDIKRVISIPLYNFLLKCSMFSSFITNKLSLLQYFKPGTVPIHISM